MRQLFLGAYKKFTDTFDNIDGTPEMKDKLNQASQNLRRYLREMDRGSIKLHPLRAMIDHDSEK